MFSWLVHFSFHFCPIRINKVYCSCVHGIDQWHASESWAPCQYSLKEPASTAWSFTERRPFYKNHHAQPALALKSSCGMLSSRDKACTFTRSIVHCQRVADVLHLHHIAWELFFQFQFRKLPWLASESALFAAFVPECILWLHHPQTHFQSTSNFMPAPHLPCSRANSTTFDLKPAVLLLSCLSIILILQCSAAIHEKNKKQPAHESQTMHVTILVDFILLHRLNW